MFLWFYCYVPTMFLCDVLTVLLLYSYIVVTTLLPCSYSVLSSETTNCSASSINRAIQPGTVRREI